MKTLLILAGLSLPIFAQGGENPPMPKPVLKEAEATLYAQLEKLADLPGESCPKEYPGLTSLREVKIAYFHGYEDFAPFTTDLVHARAMVNVLKLPCEGAVAACGFTEESRNEYSVRLAKQVDSRKVVVTVYHASIDDDHGAHMDQEKSYWPQKKQSRLVREAFLASLRDADVVFYAGHSRGGAGLGFYGETKEQMAFNWVFKGPLRKMLGALGAESSRLKMLALFSCKSEEYYRGAIEGVRSDLSLLLTKDDMGYGEGEQIGLGALNSVIGLRCASELKASMISVEEPKRDIINQVKK